MTTTPSTASQPEHETIVRQGDTLTCTACGTSANAASQAPAVSIDTPEFQEKIATAAWNLIEEGGSVETTFKEVFALIDAKLAQHGYEQFNAGLKEAQKCNAIVADDFRKLRERTEKAESRLAEIQRGVEGLPTWTMRNIDGSYRDLVALQQVLELLQPQGQADTSGLPG